MYIILHQWSARVGKCSVTLENRENECNVIQRIPNVLSSNTIKWFLTFVGFL